MIALGRISDPDFSRAQRSAVYGHFAPHEKSWLSNFDSGLLFGQSAPASRLARTSLPDDAIGELRYPRCNCSGFRG